MFESEFVTYKLGSLITRSKKAHPVGGFWGWYLLEVSPIPISILLPILANIVMYKGLASL